MGGIDKKSVLEESSLLPYFTDLPQCSILLYRLFLLLIFLSLTGLKYLNYVDTCTSSKRKKNNHPTSVPKQHHGAPGAQTLVPFCL